MFENVGTLLTDPGRFFEGRSEDPSLLEPALIVAGVAIIGLVSGAITIYQFARLVPSEVQIFIVIGGAIGVVVGAFSPFISWLLYALAFQVITYFFDGEGEFRDVFALTGWGFAPAVFRQILSLVVTVYVLQSIQVAGDTAGFTTFNQRLTGRPFYLAVSGVGVLFTLWSAYIWVPAVQRVRNVTRGQAIVAVAVPVFISILLTAAGLAFSLMTQGNF